MVRDTELYHHGIKGQKWGIRRYQNEDGSLTSAGKDRYNENYSKEQRLRDEALYGKSGVKRINRSMNEGYGVQGSRSLEARRIAKARDNADTASSVGKFSGELAGWALGTIGYSVCKSAMRNSSNVTMRQAAHALDSNQNADMVARILFIVGSRNIGGSIGKNVGKDVAMKSKGYSPDLYK